MTASGNNLTEKFSRYSGKNLDLYIDLHAIDVIEVWKDDEGEIKSITIWFSRRYRHSIDFDDNIAFGENLEVGKQILSDFKRIILNHA